MSNQARSLTKELNRVLQSDPKWPGHNRKLKSTLKIIETLDRNFEQKGGVFFHTGSDAFETARKFTQIHVRQYRKTGRPSLPALALHHAEKLGLDAADATYRALLMVAVRAEMKAAVAPPYHSKFHYTDVAAVAANLLEKNNEMTAMGMKEATPLTPHEQALVLIAAIAHDLDHEGRGNPPDDLYFNEKKSFNLMKPLLEEAELSSADINIIYTILLTTSPNGPHAVLKAVAQAHREGRSPDFSLIDPENKFPELHLLASDKKLTQMAAMVSDSDLYASSGAGLESSKVMSSLLTQEMNKAGLKIDLTTDSSRKFFFDSIVGKEGYASYAGRLAANESFQDLRNKTERKLAAGPRGPHR